MSPSISMALPAAAVPYVEKSPKTILANVSSDSPKYEENSTETAPVEPFVESIGLEINNCQSSRARPRRTLDSFSLEGKVCVVTGGASGIGLEICRAILASGGEVAILDLNGELAAQQAKVLTAEYQSLYGSDPPLITTHTTDVSSPTSIATALAAVLSAPGGHTHIDSLVTSAGMCHTQDALTYPLACMRQLWSVNVDGTYCVATQVARLMLEHETGNGTGTGTGTSNGKVVAREMGYGDGGEGGKGKRKGRGGRRGGSMVFIGSMSGSVVNVPQQQTPYNVSKAAVRHMARSLAVEWAGGRGGEGGGIRVNCVSPGYVRTALTEEIVRKEPGLGREWVERTPMGRLGRPEDVVGAVVFLLSDASGFVTGAEVLVDGGYSAI